MKRAQIIPIGVAARPGRGECPPHRWRVTATVIDGHPFEHRYCTRCAAAQDVPMAAAEAPRRMAKRG